jgi:hypothetical protein
MNAARAAAETKPVSIIRSMVADQSLPSSGVRTVGVRTAKVKILLFAANPRGTDPLDLHREFREIDEEIRLGEFRDALDLNIVPGTRIVDLLRKLNEVHPSIVHFSGHGSINEEIILESSEGDNASRVSTRSSSARDMRPSEDAHDASEVCSPRLLSKSALVEVIKACNDENIRVVVLNACHTRSLAEALSEIIDCVVSMNQTISDQAAIKFAASFYGALAFGRSVKKAFDQGLARLKAEGLLENDNPELLIRSGVNASELVLVGQRDQTETNRLSEGISSVQQSYHRDLRRSPRGILPPCPDLVVGREEALRELLRRLGVVDGQWRGPMRKVTVVRGWPGQGKTTLAASLAWDESIATSFPGGVLWTSLGQIREPAGDCLLDRLRSWGLALGDNLDGVRDVTVASGRLSALLRSHGERTLLLVDDVWESEHVGVFRIGGDACPLLLTTRMPSVADDFPKDVYVLGNLDVDKALELLGELAPDVVDRHRSQCRTLVEDLECLPLSLRVAGKLLHAEARRDDGMRVERLIQELREGRRILEDRPPSSMIDLLNQTSLTVAALLEKSLRLVDGCVRERFALLGVFAPKPATFDLAGMAAVWCVPDATATADILIDRGLLEPVGSGRYQMHALLVTYARSLDLED